MEARQRLTYLWNRVGRTYHSRPLPPMVLPEAAPDGNERCARLEIAQAHVTQFARLVSVARILHTWDAGDTAPASAADVEDQRNQHRFRIVSRTLARHFRVHGDDQALQKLQSGIQNWLAGHLPTMELAMEPMNTALRLREWLWILLLAGGAPGFPSTLRRAMAASATQQASRLARHIEFDLPGNHPLPQLLAMWMFHALLADGADGSAARRWARRLERESSRSFISDGLHCELSPHYHLQMLRVLEEYRWLAAAMGSRVSEEFATLLDVGWWAVRHFTVDGTWVPLLGDNCYSFFDASLAADFHTLAALQARRERGYSDQPETESSFWLSALGPVPGPPSAIRMQAPVHLFREAGYLAARRACGPSEDLLIFDAGPLGHVPNTGHGHADWLSFVLSLDGVPLLIDPGTYRYSNSPDALWFKRARAHNTLFVDGCEAADLWRFFRWCRLPQRPVLDFRSTTEGVALTARFTGYRSLCSLIHRRQLRLDWRRGLEVEDEIDGATRGTSLGISLHFAPGWCIQPGSDGSLRLLGGPRQVRVTVESRRDAGATEVLSEPVSPAYSQLVQAPVIRHRLHSPRRHEHISTRITWAE